MVHETKDIGSVNKSLQDKQMLVQTLSTFKTLELGNLQMSVCLSICLSVCLSYCISPCLPVCLSDYLSGVSVCLSDNPSKFKFLSREIICYTKSSPKQTKIHHHSLA
jgi:hypothetical protein